MKKKLFKILTLGAIFSSGLYADIQLTMDNHQLIFLPINNTYVTKKDVMSLMRYRYVVRYSYDGLHIRNGYYTPAIYLPTYEEIKEDSEALAEKEITINLYVEDDSPGMTIVFFPHKSLESGIDYEPPMFVLQRGSNTFTYNGTGDHNWVINF